MGTRFDLHFASLSAFRCDYAGAGPREQDNRSSVPNPAIVSDATQEPIRSCKDDCLNAPNNFRFAIAAILLSPPEARILVKPKYLRPREYRKSVLSPSIRRPTHLRTGVN
jgi:hypothetical protein